jgi:formylglycine-generating enzyme required for sulfatase activity
MSETTLARSMPISEAKAPPHPGMVWIEGGEFLMGSDHHYPEERPQRRVQVEGFWIDAKPVTNRRFAEFVEATDWRTFAERPADPADYPGADPEMLEPSSLVFTPPTHPVSLRDIRNWWSYVRGAGWRHPLGPTSSIEDRMDHPVVHVAWSDVEAFALWADADLPTEAEWEYAARGGLDGAEYAWGDELMPDGLHFANVWQGEFPYENRAEDGWERTSPVGFYPPNGYGLYDMIGNVWQWTKDWWSVAHGHEGSVHCCAANNPGGGKAEHSYDPRLPDIRIPRKVLKGGSHLCAPNYCRRYRPPARYPQPVDTSTSHVGFRCVVRP